jgi:folate-dependent phosphoribosylglycinamide formyltransferase PurN
MVKNWIALFSQTGSEIANISEKLGKKPDLVITNRRPSYLREIDSRITSEKFILHETANKPKEENLKNIFKQYAQDNGLIITLHGWLRIMPPDICEQYKIYNGHPGLITKYPELKGKDPQVRMMNGSYDTMGCVLHEVTAGVDEGEILLSKEVSRKELEEQDIFRILSNISQELWIKFLKNKL